MALTNSQLGGPRGPGVAGRRRRVEVLSYWGPVACYMLLIYALSGMENPPAPPGNLSDKVVHLAEFFVLGLLLVRAVGRRGWMRPALGTAALAVGIALLYGVFDEAHQSFVPGRTVEWRDVLADVAGAGLAAMGLYAWGIIAPVFRRT